jgi:hypothetical protein
VSQCVLVFLPHLAGRAQEVISIQNETARTSGRTVHAWLSLASFQFMSKSSCSFVPLQDTYQPSRFLDDVGHNVCTGGCSVGGR